MVSNPKTLIEEKIIFSSAEQSCYYEIKLVMQYVSFEIFNKPMKILQSFINIQLCLTNIDI